MTKFRIAIIANNELGVRFIKSQLRFRENTCEIVTVTKPSDLFKHDKFHLVIESYYLHQHPMAEEIKEAAVSKLV